MTAFRRLEREVALLRAERAADARRIVGAAERTADAAEDTAASNSRMVRNERVVARRRRAVA
jgi:hypothetical protein